MRHFGLNKTLVLKSVGEQSCRGIRRGVDGVASDAECFSVWGGCSRCPRVMNEAPIILLVAFSVCCRDLLFSLVTTQWCRCWGCFNSGFVAGGHGGCQGSRASQFHGVLNPLRSIEHVHVQAGTATQRNSGMWLYTNTHLAWILFVFSCWCFVSSATIQMTQENKCPLLLR